MTTKERLQIYKKLLKEDRAKAAIFREQQAPDLRFIKLVELHDQVVAEILGCEGFKESAETIATEEDPIIREALTQSLIDRVSDNIRNLRGKDET